MGRRKREIERIQSDRDRLVTFGKRKQGLFKKAFELSVLCDCDVALLVFGPNDTLSEYASSNMELLLKQYARMCTDPHDKKNNEDLYEQHYENNRQYAGDDGDDYGGNDDYDDDEEDRDNDEDEDDDDGPGGRVSSPRKRMRKMLMSRAPQPVVEPSANAVAQAAAVDRRLDALGGVPLSPRRETAFATILAEFNDLMMIQRVTQAKAGLGPQSAAAHPRGKSPVKGMMDLSISVPEHAHGAVRAVHASDADDIHRRTKDGFFALSPTRLSREGAALARSGFLEHLDIPSPSDLLTHSSTLLFRDSSPSGRGPDDAFADLVVTGHRVSFGMPSARGRTPSFEPFDDLGLFTPKPGDDAEEVFLEHHGIGGEGGGGGVRGKGGVMAAPADVSDNENAIGGGGEGQGDVAQSRGVNSAADGGGVHAGSSAGE